uniref:Tumor protein p73 n=1 Tax=Myotis myotis TaxID=51298 RepID=A0A7J8A2X6_MYOMY|nr:tumor protein p73 [Myotis myotis]
MSSPRLPGRCPTAACPATSKRRRACRHLHDPPGPGPPRGKMSGPTAPDEGTTFQNLWNSLPHSTYFDLPQASQGSSEGVRPDSTYFDLPQASQGSSEGACGTEAGMDFHLPGMAASSVMVL